MDISTSDFLTPESLSRNVHGWRVHGSKFKAQQLKIEKFVVQKFMIEDSMVKVSAIEQSGVEKSGVDPWVWSLGLILRVRSLGLKFLGLKFPGLKCPANLSEIVECHPLKIENLSGFLTQLRSPDPNLASHQWTWPLGFYLHKKVNIGY